MDFWDRLNNLERSAKSGAAVVAYYKKLIGEHGEAKAKAIVKAMGDRPFHLIAKSVEWEGLTLSRQPTDIEKIAVKGIQSAQESGKEQVTKVLLEARARLIKDAVADLSMMKPKDYHALVLTPPKSVRKQLKGQLMEVYQRGRELVSAELDAQRPSKAQEKILEVKEAVIAADVATVPLLERSADLARVAAQTWNFSGNGHETKDLDDELIDELTDLTLSRLANSVQWNAIENIARFRAMGLVGDELTSRVLEMLYELSDAPIEQMGGGAANMMLAEGRSDEAQAQSDAWEWVEYSALLDGSVCESCEPEDGKRAKSEDELEPAPNPLCLGGDRCRCFHVWIFEESKQVNIRVKNIQNLDQESEIKITVRKN